MHHIAHSIQNSTYLLCTTGNQQQLKLIANITEQPNATELGYYTLEGGFGTAPHKSIPHSQFYAEFVRKSESYSVILEFVLVPNQNTALKDNERRLPITIRKVINSEPLTQKEETFHFIVKCFKNVNSLKFSDRINQFIVAKQVIQQFIDQWNGEVGKYIKVCKKDIVIEEETISYFKLRFAKFKTINQVAKIDTEKWNHVGNIIIEIFREEYNNDGNTHDVKKLTTQCDNLMIDLVSYLKGNLIKPEIVGKKLTDIENNSNYARAAIEFRFSLPSGVYGHDIPLFNSIKPKYRIRFLPELLKVIDIEKNEALKAKATVKGCKVKKTLMVNEDELAKHFNRQAQTYCIWNSGICHYLHEMMRDYPCEGKLAEDELYCSIFHADGIFKLRSNLFRLIQMVIAKKEEENTKLFETFKTMIDNPDQKFILASIRELKNDASFLKKSDLSILMSQNINQIKKVFFVSDPYSEIMDNDIEYLRQCLLKVYRIMLKDDNTLNNVTHILDENDHIRWKKKNSLELNFKEQLKWIFAIGSPEIKDQIFKVYAINTTQASQVVSINVDRTDNTIDNSGDSRHFYKEE